MTKQIDLNADIGELEGEGGRLLDAQILSCVTSCNIACGGHAGTNDTMARTVSEAIRQGVLIGAHPGYPDRVNFGRVDLDITLNDLKRSVQQQVEELAGIAEKLGGKVSHLKAHGALYNRSMVEEPLAKLVCDVAQNFDIGVVFGLPNSPFESVADSAGLRFIAEGFADRSYELSGTLTPRSFDGAVHKSERKILEQATYLAKGKSFPTRAGPPLSLKVQTICLHGDTLGAAKLSKHIVDELTSAGVIVRGYLNER